MTRFATCFATALTLTVLVSGCEEAPQPAVPVMTDTHGHDHDHGHGHGAPTTIGAALHEVSEVRDTVRDAAKNDNLEEAHGALHNVFDAITAIGTLTDAAELPDDAKATITSNAEVLLDSFGEIDARLHQPESGKDYKDVAENIDNALKAITAAAGPLAAHEDHDEHHDHDGEHADHDKDHDHKDGDHDKDHKDGDHKDGDDDPRDAAAEKKE